MASKKYVKKSKNEVSEQQVAQKDKSKVTMPNTVKLKLLVTIVPWKKAEYYTDLIQSFEVNMQMVVVAEGTANAKMLGRLGLVDTDKAVIFGIIQESKVSDALSVLEEKFETIRDGKGVAWTVPLTSMIGTLIYGFLSNNRMVVKENK